MTLFSYKEKHKCKSTNAKAQMQKTFHLDKMKRLLFDLISVNTSISVKKASCIAQKNKSYPMLLNRHEVWLLF